MKNKTLALLNTIIAIFGTALVFTKESMIAITSIAKNIDVSHAVAVETYNTATINFFFIGAIYLFFWLTYCFLNFKFIKKEMKIPLITLTISGTSIIIFHFIGFIKIFL